MNPLDIKALQRYLGVADDGFWGPVSTAAAQQWLRALMPSPSPWPDASALREFYGDPAVEDNLVTVVAPVALFYEGKQVTRLTCHRKVASSLLRALSAAHSAAPGVVEIYDGCYNPRRMRGGSSWSLHAWGAAIDLDAENNGNRVHWPTAASMPFSVMEAFAREGWLAAGAFWSRDAMHFQATQ